MIDKEKAIQQGINIIDSAKSSNALFEMLQDKFPQVIKDGQVSLKSIAATLGLDSSVSNISGYELTFTGKGLANALYSTPCQKVLKLKEVFTPHCRNNDSFCHTEALAEVSQKTTQNRDFSPTAQNDNYLESNNPKNTIIIGDNLDALKILKSAYSEKIKMIYIDPPYNTTSDNFIYPDNFREDYKAILKEVGLIEIDENGEETQSETLQFFKNIQSAKTHSGWLSFMLPRLKLARDLLKSNGVIFISIDDNEQANLKILCDEIFGEDNFVANIVWNSISSVLKQSKLIRKEHEYILCYAKNKDNLEFNKLENTMEFSNPDNDIKGEWFSSNAAAPNQNSDKNKFAIKLPNGAECVRNWKFSYEDFASGKVSLYFKNGNVPRLKIYKSEYESRSKILASIFKDLGSITTAKTEMKRIFDFADDLFDTPKPLDLIKQILQISTLANENDIILDFFAGSGTTAHAVMELNAEDNGNRQCILVQIDEPINEAKSKVAYDFCKNELGIENPAISDITTERVRRASAKIAQLPTPKSPPQGRGLGIDSTNSPSRSTSGDKGGGLEFVANLGFNAYTLVSKPKLIANEKGTLKLMTNANLSAFDKALNLALQSGKTLDKPLETIIKDKLYKCEDSYYAIECDKQVLENLAKTNDEYIYIDAYADINLEHFLNLNSRFKERLNVVYL